MKSLFLGCVAMLMSNVCAMEGIACMSKECIETCQRPLIANGCAVISSIAEFEAISPKQASEITSISFENMNIDYDFMNHWWTLQAKSIKSIAFTKCDVSSGYIYDIFYKTYDDNNYGVFNDIAIVNSNLEYHLLHSILVAVENEYTLHNLNIAGNNLNTCENDVYHILSWCMNCGMYLEELNLSGNHFSDSFKEKILKYQGRCNNIIID